MTMMTINDNDAADNDHHHHHHRALGLHSHPQSWTWNFLAIFWMIVLSWSPVLSSCGCLLWLHSEPCSLCPVGLGRFYSNHKKISAKPWCNGVKCHHQQLYPPSMLPAPYPSYVDLLYPSPMQMQMVQVSTYLNHGVNISQYNMTITMEVVIVVALLPKWGPS